MEKVDCESQRMLPNNRRREESKFIAMLIIFLFIALLIIIIAVVIIDTMYQNNQVIIDAISKINKEMQDKISAEINEINATATATDGYDYVQIV